MKDSQFLRLIKNTHENKVKCVKICEENNLDPSIAQLNTDADLKFLALYETLKISFQDKEEEWNTLLDKEAISKIKEANEYYKQLIDKLSYISQLKSIVRKAQTGQK